jgi:hypothetical protein
MDWTNLAMGSDLWRACVNTLMNLLVPCMLRKSEKLVACQGGLSSILIHTFLFHSLTQAQM